jgi:hypothetical protein
MYWRMRSRAEEFEDRRHATAAAGGDEQELGAVRSELWNRSIDANVPPKPSHYYTTNGVEDDASRWYLYTLWKITVPKT